MQLKCIGGPCDGVSLYVDMKYRRVGDIERVVFPSYAKTVSEMFDPEKVPELPTLSYYIYKIGVLKFAHNKNDVGEVYFLKPPEWSDWDAITYQMRK